MEITTGGHRKSIKIDSLESLIQLNLKTLEEVVSGTIDNRKAALIFTGSRTVTSELKVGIEAMKLGMTSISGVPTDGNKKEIEKKTNKPTDKGHKSP